MATSIFRFARLLVWMLILAWLGATRVIQAGELQILTEENPPASFSKDGQITGLDTEIVREIQRRIGSRAPITILPWPRAYEMVLHQSNVALFGTIRTNEREGLFKWVGPLTSIKVPSAKSDHQQRHQ